MAKNSYNNSSLRNEELNRINEKITALEQKRDQIIKKMEQSDTDFTRLSGEFNFIVVRLDMLSQKKEKL